MGRFLFVVTAVTLLALCTPVRAEQGAAQYSVASWGHKDGLPSTLIYSVAQTSDGFLWLGTDDGLVRFDGVQFTPRRIVMPNGGMPGQVRVLHVSREGELLFGAESGMVGIARKDSVDATRLDAAVESIQEAGDASLWVATNASLWHLSARTLEPIERPIRLPAGWLSGPLQSNDGREWISTHNGLFYVRAGRLEQTGEDYARLLIVPKGHPTWLDEDGRFHSLAADAAPPASGALSRYSSEITALLTDSSGAVWIGTREDGVLRYSPNEGNASLQRYTRDDGLPSNFIRSICEDAEHNIWLGAENGLVRLRHNKVESLTARDGLLSGEIASIASTGDGSVWLATADGLQRLFDGQKTDYQRGIPVLSLLISAKQELWAGTAAGLMRLRGGHLTSSANDAGLREVTALAQDDRGVLWLYDAGRGVFQKAPDRDPSLVTNPALAKRTVTAIAAGPGGSVWFGDAEGSITEERGGDFHRFSVRDGLSGGAIHGLSVAHDGELWAATERGLCFLAGTQFRCRNRSSGLPGDRVLWALPDTQGNLWLGYNIGVAEINAESLRQVTAKNSSPSDGASAPFAWPLSSSSAIDFFDESDGIASSPHLNGAAPAAFAQDGRLWLTTAEGIAVLDPGQIHANRLPPPVHIVGLEADGKAFDLATTIRLRPLTRSLQFSFTALSMTAPRKVRFRYKLESFDRDWQDGGSSREASYTNLPPGHYTFRVLAANNDGVWNNTGAELSFYLPPAWYQTLWFELLCLAAGLLAAAGFVRLRLRSAKRILRLRFEERMEERTRIAQELHDHLIQEMVGISMHLEVADELTPANTKAKNALQRALALSRSAISEGRLTLQSLRSHPVTGAALMESLRRTEKAYSEKTRNAVEYRIEGDEQLLRPEVAEDLSELGQEALRNALKHGGYGAILVRLRYGASALELLIRDEGPGMTEELQQAGVPGHFGLAGMRERAARIAGEFSILSTPEKGTTVQVAVPAIRAYHKQGRVSGNGRGGPRHEKAK